MKKIIIILCMFFVCSKKVIASYVVIDMSNNNVLLSSNMHEKRLIASITKVMTAYVIINEVDNLNKLITVGDEINDAHGSNIYLKKGEIISINDLLYGMMLRSGNDAAITLSYHLYGDMNKFVDLMNKYALKIGMKNTYFENPTGLDDSGTKNISTAYDMAILTSAAMKNSTFKKIFQTKKYNCKSNLNIYSWTNKNKTLFLKKYITGGKTGYTKKAKRTLITTASKNNMDIAIVTLNMSDDFNFHINTYDHIFSNYKKILVLNKSNVYPLANDKNIYYTNDNYSIIMSKKKNMDKYKIKYIIYDDNLKRRMKVVGKAIVLYNSKELFDTPLFVKYV